MFLHGYGAINPFIYGKWIKHLVYNGHVVLYPRYQQNIFSPAPTKFIGNIDTAFVEAVSYLQNNDWKVDTSPIVVGHSYGGSMSAYLGVNWQESRIPKPKVVFACEPGTGPFKATKLESYNQMDSDILLAVVVGDDDKTVGDEMGKNIFATSPTELKAFFHQFAHTDTTYDISAGHYEPAANDFALDNGHKNYTSQKSERVSKIDIVDTRLYWSILDNLISLSNDKNLSKNEFDKAMKIIVQNYVAWSERNPFVSPTLKLDSDMTIEKDTELGH
jgi:acetyl esterase/lipase